MSDHDDPQGDPMDVDALDEQIRDVPNPELVHQHDEDRDPLDIAIEVEHDLDDDTIRDELVDLVRERIQDEGPRE